MSMTRHRGVAAGILAAAGTAATFAILVNPSAGAAPVARCEAPGPRAVEVDWVQADCSATSMMGGAAAAYGDNAAADAWASAQSLALSIARDGGTAMTMASPLSGPAAIAMGPGASVIMRTDAPGLSIGIAGPGAKLTLDGSTATCTGGMGFIGVLPTLQGCFSPS
jgi:hypothetical protein